MQALAAQALQHQDRRAWQTSSAPAPHDLIWTNVRWAPGAAAGSVTRGCRGCAPCLCCCRLVSGSCWAATMFCTPALSAQRSPCFSPHQPYCQTAALAAPARQPFQLGSWCGMAGMPQHWTHSAPGASTMPSRLTTCWPAGSNQHIVSVRRCSDAVGGGGGSTCCEGASSGASL